MPKINHEEYEVLKELDDKWKWIARDDDKDLWAYTEIPVRKNGSNVPHFWDTETEGPYTTLELIDEIHLFQFIQWEDEEPYNIAELVEEYEDSKEYKDSLVIEYFMDKAKEGEETEVKQDKEWLKGLINEEGIVVDTYMLGRIDGQYWENENIKINKGRLFYLIDQLDGTEVLSQKWISENVEYAYFDMLDGSGRLSSATAIIKPKKLQNLLVPKQEEVDRAYKDGYEEGREHGFYKGYREGLGNKGGEPETVADVVTTFWKSFERLKEVMSMEVEELEE